MEAEIKHKKIQFWLNWTLGSFVIIPVSYMISLIVVLLVHGAFGFGQMEGGTYLSQTVMQMAGGAVIGLGTGLYQRSLLKKVFNVPISWLITLVAGFAVTELIVCIILWQLGLNRYELRFIEFRPLPEALFFACAGLIIGLSQWTILRKYFSRSFYWILASTLGWGLCVLVTLISVWAFFVGALLYGAITGAAIMWVLKGKENE
jgi:hypothetical protein